MGTDIHWTFQAKVNGAWEDVPSNYEGDRHYALFAHLAGVRNGYGFAGIKTGSSVDPIQEGRGLPDDFQIGDDEYHGMPQEAASDWEVKKEYWEYGQTQPMRWMGDHSYGWATADEILEHDWDQNAWKCGFVDMATFRTWDGVTPPANYCGDIDGHKVVKANDPCDIDDDTTHVRIFWKSASDAFDYFTDEVRRLKDQYGEVRMVFGFDS
jgi:hypothetical protein